MNLAVMRGYNIADISVLVVDDSPYMVAVVRAMLRGFGIRDVHDANDAEDALAQMVRRDIDVVIVDWLMSEVDGIAFTRAVRRLSGDRLPFTPVIMMSAWSTRERVVAARDAGVHEFLTKPFSAKALYTRIVHCLVDPRPFVSTEKFFGPDRRRFVDPTRAKLARRDGEVPDRIVIADEVP